MRPNVRLVNSLVSSYDLVCVDQLLGIKKGVLELILGYEQN